MPVWATTRKSFQSTRSFVSSEERRVSLNLLARITALRRRPWKWFPWTIMLATCWSRPTIVSRIRSLTRRPLESRRSLMLAVHAVNLSVGRPISKHRVSIIQPRTFNLSAGVPSAIALSMARNCLGVETRRRPGVVVARGRPMRVGQPGHRSFRANLRRAVG